MKGKNRFMVNDKSKQNKHKVESLEVKASMRDTRKKKNLKEK